jgi:hypothetical protein
MAILDDYKCVKCGKEAIDAWSDDVPECCDMQMAKTLTATKTFEWGSPRTYTHLREEPFSSRSELNAYAKANNMSLGESSEKVGGARNDMYEGIGKSYSYSGASGRDNPLANLPRRET